MNHVDQLTTDDRVASALTLLAIQLTEAAPALLAGRLDRAARDELADRMIELAGVLRPGSTI